MLQNRVYLNPSNHPMNQASYVRTCTLGLITITIYVYRLGSYRQKGNGMVSVVTTKVKEVSAYDRHSNEAHSCNHLQATLYSGPWRGCGIKIGLTISKMKQYMELPYNNTSICIQHV